MPIIHLEDGIPSSKKRSRTITTSDDSEVISTGTTETEFKPPKGYIWTVTGMKISVGAPAGAGAGSHRFDLFTSKDILLMQGASVFGTGILFNYNRWEVADALQKPSTEISTLAALHAIVADNENPFIIEYINVTDVTQANTRLIILEVLEESII